MLPVGDLPNRPARSLREDEEAGARGVRTGVRIGRTICQLAGIDDVSDAELACRLENIERADQIDLGAANRIGLAVRGEDSRKVNDGVAAISGGVDVSGFDDVSGPPFICASSVTRDFSEEQGFIHRDIEDADLVADATRRLTRSNQIRCLR